MDTTTQPATQTTDAPATTDAEEAAVLAAAQAADNGTPATAPAAATTEKPAGQQPATASQAKPQDGTPSATGDDANKPAGTDATKPGDKPGEKTDDDKSESAFTKAQKDKQRRDDSWKALNQEKEALRQKETQWQAQVAQLQQQVAELKKSAPVIPAGPVKDEQGCTAEDYDTLARSYDGEGETKLAELARERAAALRAKAQQQQQQSSGQPSAPSQAPHTTPEFQAQWKANAAQIVAANPELASAEHPLFKRVQALIGDQTYGRLLMSHPSGIFAALEVAKMQEAAAGAEALKQELTKAKAEIDRLNKLTQPLGGQPGGPTATKRIEDMSGIEAEAFVKAMAVAADKSG
ncbi:hypothetical protein [Geminisphaera colitermitum]|uniref:hypothetical protein n=1 Tax=Geminisphaera colitermitum TaxID=1148786 RepID=UPI0001964DD4|nr:hypothetical protein [Geminisphaera colitermitum]